MYIKNLKRTAFAILWLVNLNIFAVQYFSEAAASELTRNRATDSAGECTSSLQHVMQQNSTPVSSPDVNKLCNPGLKQKADLQSASGWNTKFQPYIDAHRKFWAS